MKRVADYGAFSEPEAANLLAPERGAEGERGEGRGVAAAGGPRNPYATCQLRCLKATSAAECCRRLQWLNSLTNLVNEWCIMDDREKGNGSFTLGLTRATQSPTLHSLSEFSPKLPSRKRQHQLGAETGRG